MQDLHAWDFTARIVDIVGAKYDTTQKPTGFADQCVTPNAKAETRLYITATC